MAKWWQPRPSEVYDSSKYYVWFEWTDAVGHGNCWDLWCMLIDK